MNLVKLNNQLRTINHKRIEYLDLEITNPMKGIVTLDCHKHTCYFKNDTFSNRIHSENYHLNSVTDLIIELGDSLQFYNKQFHNLIDLILKSMIEKNKNLREITKNQEYLKNILEENSKFTKRPEKFRIKP